jgi:hypothetical protein
MSFKVHTYRWRDLPITHYQAWDKSISYNYVLPIFLPSPACVSCYLLLNVSGNCNTCVCVCVFVPLSFLYICGSLFPPFVLGPAFWHRYEIVTARIHTESTQPQFPIQHPKTGGLFNNNKILCLEHAGPPPAWEFYATHMKFVCPIIVPNACVCAHRKVHTQAYVECGAFYFLWCFHS